MTNADKFKNIFGLYATELWSMPEKDFLKWLNSKVVSCSEFPNNSDTIYRQQAIDFVGSMNMCDEISNEACKKLTSYLDELPSVQPEIIRCKDCKYQTESWSGIKYCEAHGDHIGKDYDYCSNARRKEK